MLVSMAFGAEANARQPGGLCVTGIIERDVYSNVGRM